MSPVVKLENSVSSLFLFSQEGHDKKHVMPPKLSCDTNQTWKVCLHIWFAIALFAPWPFSVAATGPPECLGVISLTPVQGALKLEPAHS